MLPHMVSGPPKIEAIPFLGWTSYRLSSTFSGPLTSLKQPTVHLRAASLRSLFNSSLTKLHRRRLPRPLRVNAALNIESRAFDFCTRRSRATSGTRRTPGDVSAFGGEGNGTWCPDPVPCQRESAGRREMGTERTSSTPRWNSEFTFFTK